MTLSSIGPYHYVALRVTNDYTYIEQLKPNTLINLGKYGSFHSNQIFSRPYHLTFEILDKSEQKDGRELRVVSAAELHATALLEEAEDGSVDTPAPSEDSGLPESRKTNMNIHDDPTNQKLTMAEIEALKEDDMGNTKDLIAKIMQSHSALDQKTEFSLAKYTLRKHKKYTKRFTVLPLHVATLTDWFMIQRDFSKIMEVRNETLGLIGCWGNIHHSGNVPALDPFGRYLVIDDTGGLIVAAMAERMGILQQADLGNPTSAAHAEDAEADPESTTPSQHQRKQKDILERSSSSNTITVIHSNQQPNLSILRYFNFDHNNPTPSHPLSSHLRTISWLQLLDPTSDTAYCEPEHIPPETLSSMKSNRRSNYFRKRRRWERTKTIVDETRLGNFNGLIVASYTSPMSILHHCVPLLAGGAQVVVYSPHIEPLVTLVDAYSTARRTAFINTPEEERIVPGEDFPVNPTLLLVPTVHTSRVRKWQVLPGRTHPMMTSRGGSEGYVFVATRVVPLRGKIEARGRVGRRKQAKEDGEEVASMSVGGVEAGKGPEDGHESSADKTEQGEQEVEDEEDLSSRKREFEEDGSEAQMSKKVKSEGAENLIAFEGSFPQAGNKDEDLDMLEAQAWFRNPSRSLE